MPRIGCLGKIVIGLILALALVGVSAIFFPVPQPHVSLEAQSPPGFPSFITNTLLASLLTIFVLVLLFAIATRKMKLVPTGLQNLVEYVFEWLLNFCEEAAGKENGRKFFPIIATIFFYVIGAALISLIPGFEVLGWGHQAPAEGVSGGFAGTYHGFIVNVPLLKKANTDINFPLALAIIAFVFVEFVGVRTFGLSYLGRFVAVGGLFKGLKELFRGKIKHGMSEVFMGIIEMFAGIIEILSEFIRIISLTFRLFGNMTAGMILIMLILFLIPWVVGVPFYGLEALFGFVQALIFAGLTLVFAVVAMTPREG